MDLLNRKHEAWIIILLRYNAEASPERPIWAQFFFSKDTNAGSISVIRDENQL